VKKECKVKATLLDELFTMEEQRQETELEFAETSYGFRPGRNARDAMRKCLAYANRVYMDGGYGLGKVL